MFLLAALLSRLVLVLFLTLGHVGLMPDEAHYWTWSTLLDFGYYSKPPGIAWQIFLGTKLFGSSEFGVRCIALILPIFSAFIIARIIYKMTRDQAASYLAATAFILSPLGCSASICATTDSPMIVLYVLAIYVYISIERPYLKYGLCGLCIAGGGLFRWTIYSLLIAFFRQKRVLPFLLCFFVSLIGFAPSFYWNCMHDFATFRHISAAFCHFHTHAASPNPFSFLIAGFFLVSPGFFLLALPGFIHCFRMKTDATQALIRACIVLWGACLLLSFCKKVQVNWAAAAQVLSFPFLGIALHHSWRRLAYISSLALSIILQGIALSTPFFAASLLSISPFKQGLGVEQIQEGLKAAGYDPKQQFLFASRYQTTSLLWFYGQGQKKTYFFNIDAVRHNQFDYWRNMSDECALKDGLYVILVRANEMPHLSRIVDEAKRKLMPYFLQVDQHWVYPLKSIDQTVIYYMVIVKALLYNGRQPQNSLHY